MPSALVVFDWVAAFSPVCLLLPCKLPWPRTIRSSPQPPLSQRGALRQPLRLTRRAVYQRVGKSWFFWGPSTFGCPALSSPRPAPGHPGEAATSGARASGLLSDWAGSLNETQGLNSEGEAVRSGPEP